MLDNHDDENTIMMTTSLAKTTMMIVCTALLCDRPFDVDCETADWSLSHLLPIVIGDHGSRVDPDVANDLLLIMINRSDKLVIWKISTPSRLRFTKPVKL